MRRCLNCMEVYDEQYEICPYCGFKHGTPPKVASHLAPGTVIAGRYIIGTVIGYGGFGVTYQAWDRELSIRIAVKEYYPNGLVNRVPGTREIIVLGGEKREQYVQGLKRFLEEARTMAKFSSVQNIVHVYSFLEENNTAYIMMEYLAGLSLKDYLAQFADQKMPLDEALSVISEVGKALTAIHKGKVVHRDISPDNIFLCMDGRVKLLDFGAARLSTGEKTQTLSVVLKPGYAPPEQYRSKSKQGPRTDVYALAATLYRLITGKLPTESLDRVVEDTLPKPTELNPELPAWIDSVILTGMAKNAEVRFASVEKFMEALDHEKAVNLPEKRIKIRRFTRAATIILLAVITGAIGFRYFGIYDDISGEGTPDGEITFMAAVSSEADKTRLEEFKESFEKKFSGKTLNLQLVDEAAYADALNGAIAGEEAPDLFMGEYLSEENDGAKASVNGVIGDLSLKNLYFYKENEEKFREMRALPLCFDTFVIYENIYLSKQAGESYVGEVTDVTAADSGSKLFDEKYTASSTDSISGLPYREDAKKAFLGEKATYYIGSVNERSEIQATLSGYAETGGIAADGKGVGSLASYVSINNNSSSEKKRIAELMLRYALSEEGQNVLFVRNQNMLPINKKTFSTFTDINESLDFIEPNDVEISQ